MIQKSSLIKSLILVFIGLLSMQVSAQQDPQYTQYMYNTMSVNPAYAGQRDVLSATGLYRTQWVGIDGAPKTMTFGIHSPLKNNRLGLGLNIVSDQIGPANETTIDANFSYSLPMNKFGDILLSFGIKGGFHVLGTDWSKGLYQNPDRLFNENLNFISPTIGTGLYLHSDYWYVGVSVPNFITTNHYSDLKESLAVERIHYFLIGGYVYDLSENTKLKPAFLVKGVSGSPLIADLSLNALVKDKLTLGLGYRWGDSVSGMVGFQISDEIFIGYAYDLTTTNLNNYNSGSHEIMIRFEFKQAGKILSPRFF
jgi:type IX secretion system PorP/SprF family membrane protein